jgi:hypothetical protein
MFRMILSVNTDYFLKHTYPVDLCNGNLYFLCGTDLIISMCFGFKELDYPKNLFYLLFHALEARMFTGRTAAR